MKTVLAAAALAALLCACAPLSGGDGCAGALAALQQRYKGSFTEFFKVRDEGAPGAPALKGVTTEPEALAALRRSCGEACAAGVRLLPDAGRLGGRTWALVSAPVATFHNAPAYTGAIETQAVLGTPLRLLDRSGNWFLAQSPEGCIEWVNGSQVKRLTEQELADWNARERVIVTAPELPLTEEGTGAPLGLATGGSVLALESELPGGMLRIRMPEGGAALLPREGTAPLLSWSRGKEALSRQNPGAFREEIARTALSLLGRSYLWAGASTLAMDCSGFTQTVWRMNGLIIPRNSRQQAYVAPKLPGEASAPYPAGELLFFGSRGDPGKAPRVGHVGIALGNSRFIHALGRVRTASLSPGSPEYDAYNAGRFLWATPMPAEAPAGGCVTRYHDNPFFSARPAPLAPCRHFRDDAP